MKNLTAYFVLVVLTLTACNKTDKKVEAIKNDIKQNALGQDINYKPISTEVIATVTAGKSLSNLLKYPCEDIAGTADSACMVIDEVLDNARETNNVSTFNVWNNIKNRLKKVDSMKPDEVDFQVVKHHYTINNPLLNGVLVDITNYYYFTGNDSLLGKISDDTFNDYSRSLIQYPEQPHEAALYHFASN